MKSFFRTIMICIIMTKESEYKFRFKRRKKEEAIKAFGGKCQLCGYNKCMGAMDFHHIMGEKKVDPSFAIIQWKWDRVKEELDKCILLCSNCHREIHYNQTLSHELLKLKRPWFQKECPLCKQKFDSKNPEQIYCSSPCQRISQRKTQHPSKEELKALMETTSWVQLGKMFGVSDNAVRKWAKKYGLL